MLLSSFSFADFLLLKSFKFSLLLLSARPRGDDNRTGSKKCDLLIEVERDRSSGVDPDNIEQLRQRVEALSGLTDRAQHELEEREKKLFANVKVREEQIRISEEGRL